MTPPSNTILHNLATQLRIDSVRSTTEAGSGHPTTCLSAADLLAVLFFDELRFDPMDPQHPEADRFVLSKGHAAPILYAAWAAAEDDQLRAASLSAFVAAVRGHVAELAGKKYQDNEKLQAPDFVLMYMPFEHALATAMQADPDLFALAWRQRVAIVGPNTLVVTMGVVARIWQYETNRQNAQKIADEAAKLLDQAAEFAHALDDIEAGLRKALDAHADAKKRVFTGNNHILRQAGKLKALGVRNRKAMPASLLRDDALPGPEEEEAAGDPPPG